ncbi:hypothetical protein JQ567_13285 [Bradyrhizobium sp. AUGA SZCCT0431]|nr:hypothetical protein [Bradyrhizobium sp. AUGA SZCCT0431]
MEQADLEQADLEQADLEGATALQGGRSMTANGRISATGRSRCRASCDRPSS